MPIFYSLIARSSTVLCERTEISVAGNFSAMAAHMLRQLPSLDTKKVTHSSGDYLFHIVIADGITFMCITDREMSHSQSSGFLAEIQRKFTLRGANLVSRARTARSYELNKEFANVLASEMARYSKGLPEDELSVLRDEVERGKRTIIECVDEAVEKGEKTKLLADQLSEDYGGTFKKSSTSSHTHIPWWKNKKRILVIVIILIVILIVAILLAILASVDVIQ